MIGISSSAILPLSEIAVELGRTPGRSRTPYQHADRTPHHAPHTREGRSPPRSSSGVSEPPSSSAWPEPWPEFLRRGAFLRSLDCSHEGLVRLRDGLGSKVRRYLHDLPTLLPQIRVHVDAGQGRQVFNRAHTPAREEDLGGHVGGQRRLEFVRVDLCSRDAALDDDVVPRLLVLALLLVRVLVVELHLVHAVLRGDARLPLLQDEFALQRSGTA